MKDTLPDSGFFTEDLATRDAAIFGAIGSELGRQRDEIELIASENIVSRAVLQAQGSVMTNKYAEGYPGPALLRRLPVRRRRRDPRHRARLQALRRRLRQRPAELRQPGQPGGVPRAPAARRHLPRHGPLRRRPPDPRRASPTCPASGSSPSTTASAARTSGSTTTRSAELAAEHRPKLIIAGGSAIPRLIDFARFRAIAD